MWNITINFGYWREYTIYILCIRANNGNCNDNEHHYRFINDEWIKIGNKLLILFYWKNVKININGFNKLNYCKKKWKDNYKYQYNKYY